MTHSDKIKSILSPHVDTLVFRKFFLWILYDPKYGTICKIHYLEREHTKKTSELIDLCKEWVNTGEEPIFWNSLLKKVAFFAAVTPRGGLKSNLDYAMGFINWGGHLPNITLSEINSAQLDKLNSLIENNGEDEGELYSWEDYGKV